MSWADYFKPKLKAIERGPMLPQGSIGTEIYGGYLESEYIGELRNTRNRYDIYHQMRSSSGTCKMCINAVRSSILSSRWSFAPKEEFSGESRAIDQAVLLNKLFPKEALVRLIEDMTTSVIFGFFLGERYYRPIQVDGKTLLAPVIRLMSQKTIDQWIVSPEGTLDGIIQRAYGDDAIMHEAYIDRSRLVHFAIEQEGDNFEGISMLRPCYGPWVRKKRQL